MGRMVRKQIYVSTEQETMLKRRAEELNITESALIRWGIDQATRLCTPLPRDEEAWQDALAFMRERARIQSAVSQRGWDREDLHEGRPKYLSH